MPLVEAPLATLVAAPPRPIVKAPVRTSCLLCGSRRRELLVEAPDFEYACKPGAFALVRCGDCGHVSVRDMPRVDGIAALYPTTYYTINPQSPLYLRGFVYRQKIARDMRRLMRFIESCRAKTVVDLGCGDAARLMGCAKSLGEQVEWIGMDLAFESRVQQVAAEVGVELIEGNIESDLDALPHGTCDLVVMTQLIEHLIDPLQTMQRLHDRLSAGGKVLIETPNLGGLDHAIFRKRFWGGYHIPRHLHLFTPTSLKALLERSGYRVVDAGFLPSPGFWIISLRNWLGLSSAKGSRSWWEVLNFANLPTVGFFTALDTLRIKLGLQTSNQFALAEKVAY